jgi:Tol biopolymer transport system component
MRHRIELLSLIAGLCVADVGMAQRLDIQPVQWIIKESAALDMWAYIAPDGETITFSRALDLRTFELLATDSQGRQPRPFLTSSPAASLTRGAWSRPHRRLAFTGSGSDGSDMGLYVADVTGENVRRVPAKGLSGHFMYPSWMPDGRSVVVVDAAAPGGSTLYRIDLESGDSSALTTPSQMLVGMPSVAPNGKVVAFAGQLNEGQKYDQTRNQIWLLPIGGGKPSQVSAGQGRQPDWSPDGRWLAFASGRDDPAGNHAVFVVNRAGRNLTQLTEHSVNAQHPVWSPDGRWLVFSAQADEQVDEKTPVFGLARISVPKLPR